MNQQTISILQNGGIGILPTDTIYGLVGQALCRKAVERIYAVRKRSPEKPCIILISDISDIEKFSVTPDVATKQVLEKYWPGQVSIILPCDDDDFEYLHRGTGGLAFRLPDVAELREMLRQTGPLIAPSANPEGLPAAKNSAEARAYFGNEVDFYEDGGTMESAPSTLIEIEDGRINVIRQGSVYIDD